MNKIIASILIICTVNVLVYYIHPQPETLILTRDKGLKEPWRLLTYQFEHISQTHLLENIIGLMLVGFIAREANIKFKDFIFVYIASVFIVIPFVYLVYPTDTVAGNSTGIYGLLSYTLLKERKIIPPYLSLPLFTLVMFTAPIINLYQAGALIMKNLQSSIYHFIGYLSGIGVFHLNQRKPYKKVLRRT
ncbi:MAG: hypothetical protein B6U97_01125 [Candidatus Altiarchaeales archaeon ex4484_96]|nr:MAG: hypothetical protein B6U97_01125 [Candidatus Altiarchaeales archaeon ex4484_96]